MNKKNQAQARLPSGAADVGVSVMMCKTLGGEDANRLFSKRNMIYETKYWLPWQFKPLSSLLEKQVVTASVSVLVRHRQRPKTWNPLSIISVELMT